jgi:hypothetical protein
VLVGTVLRCRGIARAAIPTTRKKTQKTKTTGTAAARARAKPRLVKGLQITHVDDGYIVYDASRERVHYLNHTAGLVMDLCTGQNRWSAIAALVGKAFDLPRAPIREVGAILTQLTGEGLVSLDR